MPRQLKTYVTSSGFFELAVAAPTMKAALEIWGAGPDLFRRGYAKETNDAAIVKATTVKPGTVLQRAVGATGVFKEHADLPDVSAWAQPEKKSPKPKAPAPKVELAPKPEPAKAKSVNVEPAKPTAAEKAAERKAAQLYAAAQKKLERDAARAEAAERNKRKRRENAAEKAKAALQEARATHDERVVAIEREREDIERRAREEDDRWDNQKQKLQAAVRDA